MFNNKHPMRYVFTDPRAQEPKRATPGAAAFDFYAIENAEIRPGYPATLRTGIAVEVPAGWCMLVNSRSGHGFNFDVRLANAQGWIDSDYRGEIKVRLTADGKTSLRIKPGDRIAQFMLVPVLEVALVNVASLSATERGDGGFGSTGGVSA